MCLAAEREVDDLVPVQDGPDHRAGHVNLAADAVTVQGPVDSDIGIRCKLLDDAGNERAMTGGKAEIIVSLCSGLRGVPEGKLMQVIELLWSDTVERRCCEMPVSMMATLGPLLSAETGSFFARAGRGPPWCLPTGPCPPPPPIIMAAVSAAEWPRRRSILAVWARSGAVRYSRPSRCVSLTTSPRRCSQPRSSSFRSSSVRDRPARSKDSRAISQLPPDQKSVPALVDRQVIGLHDAFAAGSRRCRITRCSSCRSSGRLTAVRQFVKRTLHLRRRRFPPIAARRAGNVESWADFPYCARQMALTSPILSYGRDRGPGRQSGQGE